MFRTSIIHPQERFQAVCYKFDMRYFAYYSIGPEVIVGLHVYCKMIHGPYNIKLLASIYYVLIYGLLDSTDNKSDYRPYRQMIRRLVTN